MLPRIALAFICGLVVAAGSHSCVQNHLQARFLESLDPSPELLAESLATLLAEENAVSELYLQARQLFDLDRHHLLVAWRDDQGNLDGFSINTRAQRSSQAIELGPWLEPAESNSLASGIEIERMGQVPVIVVRSGHPEGGPLVTLVSRAPGLSAVSERANLYTLLLGVLVVVLLSLLLIRRRPKTRNQPLFAEAHPA